MHSPATTVAAVTRFAALGLLCSACARASTSQAESAPAVTIEAAPPPRVENTPPAPDVRYRWENIRGTNLKIELPSHWSTEARGKMTLVVSPAPGVRLQILASNDKGMSETELLAFVRTVLPGAEVSPKFTKLAQHGLKGVLSRGNGTQDGRNIDWISLEFDDGADHMMLLVAFLQPGAKQEHSKTLQRIFDSIQPADAAL